MCTVFTKSDILEILMTAWKSIQYTETEISLKLDKLILDIGKSLTIDEVGDFKNLKRILRQHGTITIDETDSIDNTIDTLYGSLILLLNSNYDKYNIIDIGRAEELAEQAINMYGKLYGKQCQKIITPKDELLQRQLKDGSIIYRIEVDIKDVQMLHTVESYITDLRNRVECITIGIKGIYAIQVVRKQSYYDCVIDTTYRLRIVNLSTVKEKYIKRYSDIKRILNE